MKVVQSYGFKVKFQKQKKKNKTQIETTQRDNMLDEAYGFVDEITSLSLCN